MKQGQVIQLFIHSTIHSFYQSIIQSPHQVATPNSNNKLIVFENSINKNNELIEINN